VGPVAGASALIALPEIFRFLTDHRMIFYGLILIVMMLFRREGIFSRRTYSLKITPPWEKKETGLQYLVGDKFLTEDSEQEKDDDASKN